MRVSLILILLFATPALPAQPAPKRAAAERATRLAAERAWPSFYASLRDAVKRRDRQALRKFLAPDIFFSGGGGDDNEDGDTRDEAFEFWDEHLGRGWKAFEKLLRGSAVTGKGLLNSHDGTPQKVAPPAINKRVNVLKGGITWYAVFEFREGRWYCTIFNECCD